MKRLKTPTPEELQAEATALLDEVHVARRAAQITAEMVVEQFVKMEQVHGELNVRADTERQLRERLAEELAESEAREREIARARAAADAANRAKSTFLANMSHELRTPLNAVIGYSELLMDELGDSAGESTLSDLGKINSAARHLLALINDILDLSKIEAGKMELHYEVFDVKTVVDETVAMVRPVADKNDNRLEVRCDADVGTLHADMLRVRQCLFNLVSNACKFTHAGVVTLSAHRQTQDGEASIRLEVGDTGIGMTAEQLGKLFQPFTQVDPSSTRRYGGTGLGLSITKRFCESMGGSVGVTSEPGKGSTFSMTLPARAAKRTNAPSAPGRPVGASGAVEDVHGRTVLIIDDDPAAREAMQRALRAIGLHAVSVEGGEEGIRLAREIRPHVILLDVMMPQMDGWEVLATIKAEPELAEIPVVMATIVEDRSRAFALGAAEYLVKPVDRARLLEVVERLSRGRTSRCVLVVDDDPTVREHLRRILAKESWTVVEAENGRAGLACLERIEPSLVLLDLMMPEMDGFEFLERLRSNEQWKTMPVIVITAKDLSSDERNKLCEQVQRVLFKGAYSWDELLGDVKSLALRE